MNKFSSLCIWEDNSCQEYSGTADISMFQNRVWWKLEIAVAILYSYMGRRLQEPEAALKAAPQYKNYNG